MSQQGRTGGDAPVPTWLYLPGGTAQRPARAAGGQRGWGMAGARLAPLSALPHPSALAGLSQGSLMRARDSL